LISSTLTKYAEALADVAEETGLVDRIIGQLDGFKNVLEGHEELREVLSSPGIPLIHKRPIVEKIATRLDISRIVVNFLLVLLERDRLDQLDEACDAFQEVLDRRSGIVRATVISARPLAQSIRERLEKTVGNLSGREVKLDYEVDGDLIGGLRLQLGSMVFDGSVRTQLEELRRRVLTAVG
jgi:F-type H+-transporting ATPase subunit delta